MATPSRLVACHDCDALQRVPPLAEGAVARCPRCNALLARSPRRSLERTTALSLGALALLVSANAFPLLTLSIQGSLVDATILSGVRTLWDQDMAGLAALVFATTFAAPLAHVSLLLYVLVPVGLGWRAPGALGIFRMLNKLRVWSMTEVFVLGVLVSLVKLADLAEIVPGLALWSLGLLIPVLTASVVTLDPQVVWEGLTRARVPR